MSDKVIEIQANDVIQIIPSLDVKEAFHRKLAFVDKVEAWGVQAYVATFDGNAYIRLTWGSFVRIGPAPYSS
jgi:hypothetical protein